MGVVNTTLLSLQISHSCRLMEEGKLAEAEAEKHRLENSQRDRRKNREGSGDDHKPLWFK